jgi:uncharacterized protein YbaA (DUF1428 family)
MTYVDGFVLAIPKNKIEAYKKMAKEGAKTWKKHGALQYFECKGDDMHPKMVTFTFPKMVKLKPTETVWFSFIIYKSKAHRNAVNAKVMKEMEEKYKDAKDMQMPFDMKRMAYGGFKTIVQA